MSEPFISDRWITCTDDGVEITGLLLPVGHQAHSLRLDPGRAARRDDVVAGKGPDLGHRQPALLGQPRPPAADEEVGLILDLGQFVRPFITPDDPDAVDAAITQHIGVGPGDGTTERGRVI